MAGRRDGSRAELIRSLGALSSVGIAFVLAVFIGFLVGLGLDRLTGLSPLFTILFFFIGVAAGIANVVKAAGTFGRGPRQ